MGQLEGKVAFITGAARGQGRSHAVRFAREGADIIALDVAETLPTIGYPGATEADLAETVRLVEEAGGRIHATKTDVRDYAAVKATVDEGVDRFGRLDIVSANAGIFSVGRAEELTSEQWNEVIDVNLTGVWKTCKAAIPHIRAGGRGGSIVLTSSISGMKADPNFGHYIASKHAVVGLMQTMALELAPEFIRVNTVNPTNANTPMIRNEMTDALFAPDLAPEERTEEALRPRFSSVHAMPIPWVEPEDVTEAVLWLASDASRFVTGIQLPVDGGRNTRN
ncbi:mycofactocin-coupled SDR family oxidoreductase [Agromyces tropicus]|uniref:Mycofactocin-coupled SDR family oxidoreductase n=1 Tax=Agromyces tropicus TaxID=555371 RepID=A0ABN2U372_9MICO